MRTVTATVTDPTGHPREGLQIAFVSDSGDPVAVLTDASGDYRAALDPGTYTLAFPDAVRLNGDTHAYPAGTVFRVSVPAGAGPVAMVEDAPGGFATMADRVGESLTGLLTLALFANRMATLEDRVRDLEQSIAAGGQAAGRGLADAAGEVD